MVGIREIKDQGLGNLVVWMSSYRFVGFVLDGSLIGKGRKILDLLEDSRGIIQSLGLEVLNFKKVFQSFYICRIIYFLVLLCVLQDFRAMESFEFIYYWEEIK